MKIKMSDWLVPLLVTVTWLNLSSVIKISVGDRYVFRLNRWYHLAGSGDWQRANKLEQKLDKFDTKWFRDRNKSEDLKRRLNELTIKSNKTADDWMEMASVQSRLQKLNEAKESVVKAHEADPIRSDIEKVYYSWSF